MARNAFTVAHPSIFEKLGTPDDMAPVRTKRACRRERRGRELKATARRAIRTHANGDADYSSRTLPAAVEGQTCVRSRMAWLYD